MVWSNAAYFSVLLPILILVCEQTVAIVDHRAPQPDEHSGRSSRNVCHYGEYYASGLHWAVAMDWNTGLERTAAAANWDWI